MSDPSSEPWPPPRVWEREPIPGAVRLVAVCDPEMGCIAEATDSEGRRFYGVDPHGEQE